MARLFTAESKSVELAIMVKNVQHISLKNYAVARRKDTHVSRKYVPTIDQSVC